MMMMVEESGVRNDGGRRWAVPHEAQTPGERESPERERERESEEDDRDEGSPPGLRLTRYPLGPNRKNKAIFLLLCWWCLLSLPQRRTAVSGAEAAAARGGAVSGATSLWAALLVEYESCLGWWWITRASLVIKTSFRTRWAPDVHQSSSALSLSPGWGGGCSALHYYVWTITWMRNIECKKNGHKHVVEILS